MFQKTNFSYPLIRTLTCAYEGVRNVSLLESFAYVLNGWLLLRKLQWVITIIIHFFSMLHFYTPWKHKKTILFLMFSWGIANDIGKKSVKLVIFTLDLGNIHCVKCRFSPNFPVWKFCGKVQFPQSFGRFAQNSAEIVLFDKISTPGNLVKRRCFTHW